MLISNYWIPWDTVAVFKKIKNLKWVIYCDKYNKVFTVFSLSAISEQVHILVRDNGCTVMKAEVLHGALHQVRGHFAAENQTQWTFHVEIKLSSKYKYLEFYF